MADMQESLPFKYLSFEAFRSLSIQKRFEKVQEWAAERQGIQTLLTVWMHELFEQYGQQAEVCLTSCEILIEKIESFKYNVNARLQLEDLALSI